MCFSAPVSFAAAGVLVVAGAAAMRKAGKTPLRWYAAVPLLFGVQQFIEGLQWIVDKPGAVSAALGYAYLLFAFLFWPVYIPFAVRAVETNAARRRGLRVLTIFGLFASLSLLFVLLIRPLMVAVVGASIDYQVSVPFSALGVVLYVLIVCGAGLLSSRPGIRLFSGAVFLSAVASMLIYQYAFTSVWCFFAAALSVLVYFDVGWGRGGRGAEGAKGRRGE